MGKKVLIVFALFSVACSACEVEELDQEWPSSTVVQADAGMPPTVIHVPLGAGEVLPDAGPGECEPTDPSGATNESCRRK